MTEFQEALIAGFYFLLLLVVFPVSVFMADSIKESYKKEVQKNRGKDVGRNAR